MSGTPTGLIFDEAASAARAFGAVDEESLAEYLIQIETGALTGFSQRKSPATAD